jgi:hypothetical protein
MSSCCPSGSSETEICPECGEVGSTVDPITLKALLTSDGLRRGVPPNPRFCASPLCAVVYFDINVPVTFRQRDLTVPVQAKKPLDDSVPVCYCFGHTPASIRAEITRGGKSTAFETISSEVKAGHCACEVRNPKGDCCLGDVLKTERRLMNELASVPG